MMAKSERKVNRFQQRRTYFPLFSSYPPLAFPYPLVSLSL